MSSAANGQPAQYGVKCACDCQAGWLTAGHQVTRSTVTRMRPFSVRHVLVKQSRRKRARRTLVVCRHSRPTWRRPAALRGKHSPPNCGIANSNNNNECPSQRVSCSLPYVTVLLRRDVCHSKLFSHRYLARLASAF